MAVGSSARCHGMPCVTGCTGAAWRGVHLAQPWQCSSSQIISWLLLHDSDSCYVVCGEVNQLSNTCKATPGRQLKCCPASPQHLVPNLPRPLPQQRPD